MRCNLPCPGLCETLELNISPLTLRENKQLPAGIDLNIAN
jgi:hypothetical protein